MQLKYALETPLDSPIEPGMGASFFLEGWAFCPQQKIAALSVELGGREFAVTDFGNIRKDIQFLHGKQGARSVRALLSGFWVPLPILPRSTEQTLPLRLIAKLSGGETLRSPYHHVHVLAGAPRAAFPRLADPLPPRPLIHIAMTTYNPSERVFRRQIDSIRAQDYSNWVCLIQDDCSNPAAVEGIRRVLGDDPRFIFQRNERNLGFYFNFENVLRRIPPTAQLVCLSDQDDYWNPEKLSALLSGFSTPDTLLVYSDMRIVSSEGEVLSNTFWSFRKNNYTDLEALFFANTITGAAMMFKAALLPQVLPFPHKLGHFYHDWWIALLALAAGRIGFIDRPLYDYYQHASNVIGWTHMGKAASALQFLRSNAHRRQLAQLAVSVYDTNGKFLANTILALRLRVPDSPKQAAFDRLGGIVRKPIRTLLGQYIRALARHRASQPREKHYLMAYVLVRMLKFHFAIRPRKRQGAALPGESPAPSPAQRVDAFAAQSAPLNLAIRAGEPRRVNMFLATIDFRYFFGGYIGMFHLARRLAKSGFKTRFIILEKTAIEPSVWSALIKHYAGLEDIFDLVEIACAADRSVPIAVSPRDRFIATSCWSAWVADAAAKQLAAGPFIFMIQEYEPHFDPHGSHYARCRAAYDLDLYAVFSTEMLREFFRDNRIGPCSGGPESLDARSIVFHNAVLGFNVTAAALERPAGTKRRFLFYCRPELHAQRNMFELGLMALRTAIEQGALDPAQWDFFGIGTVGEPFAIPLPKGSRMEVQPKLSLKDYAALLPGFDLGMSLMCTPHPSLVPLEMAAAGLVTVTNSYANKTAEKLQAISANFEVGAPTIASLAAALRRAEARVPDLAARVTGAGIHWPTSWDQALAPDTLRPLLEELAETRNRQGEPIIRMVE